MITPSTTLADLAIQFAAFALSAACALLPNGTYHVELSDPDGTFADATRSTLWEAMGDAFAEYLTLKGSTL